MNILVFDLDGTLIDRDTEVVLPGVKEWFDLHRGDPVIFCLCTNQGGVGLRYWQETGGFGTPENFPDEMTARAHIQKASDLLGVQFKVYVCFAYQSQKSGKWSPTPPGKEYDPEWQRICRKPAPGMLWRITEDHFPQGRTDQDSVVFVGNDPADEQAATDAMVTYAYASEFFGQKEVEHE